MKQIGLVLLWVLALSNGNAQTKKKDLSINKDENTLLWQISGNGLQNPSYLFGTFHLMCKNDIHFSKQLQEAVINSDEIYMELDMSNPAALAMAWQQMNMKGDKTLKDFYTDTEYARLETFFKDSLNVPLDPIQHFKPYFLIALLYPKMLPCKDISGVEEQLVQLAKANQKKIEGLETMEFQSSVFDSIPYSDQARDLLQSVDSIPENKQEFLSMLAIYKAQQIDKIKTLFEKSEFGMEDHEDILVDDRNRNWVAQLNSIMKTKSVFVAVGAGHLVGSKGLIALLKQEGYKVQPLKN